ncbi:Uncharacterised protein [BD1-7 clade bacterium]|uniref:Uncharacterized protein n=1 Tax=BD1-7 clade bacterium TaxID=2029982 RepID=A0A5S9QM62_9GAMM|nr:Uncharacterised protein [BD1-7 clade bacterium]CAA0116415.1 Uncharacterised protein [BD1-7 clade bacterium]CAA0120069.1 Uncharacterised protein [BD1-7 clade bacterium]
MYKTLVVASLAAASTLSHAYQVELNYGGSYNKSKTEHKETGTKTKSTPLKLHSVDMRVYLTPVSIEKGPLALAAFFDKASAFDLNYNRVISDNRTENIGLGYSGVTSDIIYRASVNSNIGEKRQEQRSYNIEAGAYISDWHTLTGSLQYSRGRSYADNPGFGNVAPFRSEAASDSYSMAVNYLGVVPLGSSDQFLQINGSLGYGTGTGKFDSAIAQSNSDNSSFSLRAGVTWYPIKSLGLSANLNHFTANSDSESVTTLPQGSSTNKSDTKTNGVAANLGIQWFPIPALALRASYSISTLTNDTGDNKFETDGNGFAGGLSYRF